MLTEPRNQVRAAGAVLWRSGDDSTVEVAVVHRPRYDDWSLPKGKLKEGETVPAAAVREVAEETGFATRLGRRLTTVHYPVAEGIEKCVVYFSAAAGEGAFTAGVEVDQIRWLTVEQAVDLLSYQRDRVVLEDFTALPARLHTLLLVRHAKAGKREDWDGPDHLRPLSYAGRQQAEALRKLLPVFGPRRMYSAPAERCVRTIADLAKDIGVPVGLEPALSEDGYWPDPKAGLCRLHAIVAAGREDSDVAVVSSQGGVIPDVVEILASLEGLRLGEISSKKGSLWVLSFESISDRPRLVAADYYPSPLPELTEN